MQPHDPNQVDAGNLTLQTKMKFEHKNVLLNVEDKIEAACFGAWACLRLCALSGELRLKYFTG